MIRCTAEADDGEEARNVTRPYTPTTSNFSMGFFDLVLKVYWPDTHPKFPLGGEMTQVLDALRIGDPVLLKGPFGHAKYGRGGFFQVKGQTRHAANVGLIC